MIETKAESPNYLVNPYHSLGPLPFDTDEYVIRLIVSLVYFFLRPLPFGSIRSVTCQASTSEVSFDGRKPLSAPSSSPGWIFPRHDSIHHSFSRALDRR